MKTHEEVDGREVETDKAAGGGGEEEQILRVVLAACADDHIANEVGRGTVCLKHPTVMFVTVQYSVYLCLRCFGFLPAFGSYYAAMFHRFETASKVHRFETASKFHKFETASKFRRFETASKVHRFETASKSRRVIFLHRNETGTKLNVVAILGS
jgi:hypothetical protein